MSDNRTTWDDFITRTSQMKMLSSGPNLGVFRMLGQLWPPN